MNAETDVDQTWQAWARSDPLEVISFWWWSGSAYGFRITFSFSSPLRNRGFWIFVSISDTRQRPIYTILGLVTDADKIIHPQHFGTELTDIWIRINPKIRIWILDHYCLNIWHWQRFALSEWFCCLYVCFTCICLFVIFHFFLVLFVRCHNNINICYFVMVSVTCCLLAYYMYFFVKKFCW